MKKRLITCTEENQKEMAAAIKAWPALHALVQSLRSQGVFPGMRALRITLTGSEAFVAQGLGAITAMNAAKAE